MILDIFSVVCLVVCFFVIFFITTLRWSFMAEGVLITHDTLAFSKGGFLCAGV